MKSGNGSGLRYRALAVLLILTALMMCSMVIPDNLTEEAEGARPVMLAIEMEKTRRDSNGNMQIGNTIEVRTGPGETGMATMYARVRLYRAARLVRNKIFVHLQFATVNNTGSGVLGTVSPSLFEFPATAKSGWRQVRINIMVQPMTNQSTGIHPPVKGEITGTWTAEPNAGAVEEWIKGDLPPHPVFVNVRPFQYLILSFDPPMVQIPPGGTGHMEVIINNQGNGNDRVDLKLVNPGLMAQDGWVFEWEKTSLDIGPKEKIRVGIDITSPRQVSGLYHIEVVPVTVKATSHYSRERARLTGEDQIIDYETDFYVFLYGIDFLYVPIMWAIVLYIVIGFVMFNLGFNVFTLRRRRFSLPEGKKPGFFWVKDHISNPELRARRRENRRKRREARRENRKRKKKEKESDKEPLPSPGKKAPPITDLKRKDLDIDEIDLDDVEEDRGKEKKRLPSPFSKKKRKEEMDVRDALSLLDD